MKNHDSHPTAPPDDNGEPGLARSVLGGAAYVFGTSFPVPSHLALLKNRLEAVLFLGSLLSFLIAIVPIGWKREQEQEWNLNADVSRMLKAGI